MSDFGVVYGSALYEVAADSQKETEICGDLDMVCAAFQDNRDYIRLISSRMIAKDERLSLIQEAFSNRVDPRLLSFMKLLCERNAFYEIFECHKEYVKIYNEKHGIEVARVTTATPMTSEQREHIREALGRKTGKTIVLKETVDPAIRGGVRCEMSGVSYDNTIKRRLEQISQALKSQA